MLGGDEEVYEEEGADRVSRELTNHEHIVELNRSGRMPEGNPTELEAGANRCAAG